MFIGHSGFPEVAEYGFHSQAGWIAFNLVACGLAYLSRRSSWLNRSATRFAAQTDSENPTLPYLMPLLAILMAGAVSHAMSGTFETFYPLRLLAGGTALWLYRRQLASLDWRFSWRRTHGGRRDLCGLDAGRSLPDALCGAAGRGDRDVPGRSQRLDHQPIGGGGRHHVPLLAEELAYRGYLMRQLMRREFDFVPFRGVTHLPLLVTSVAFGMAHGSLWLPGILAGLAYGRLVMQRGSLGEAVAAHATTNGLIAIAVLGYGQWQLW